MNISPKSLASVGQEVLIFFPRKHLRSIAISFLNIMTTGLPLFALDVFDAPPAVASISADELRLSRIECEAIHLAALLWSKFGPRTESFRAAICTCYSLGLSNTSITLRLRLRLRQSDPIKQPSFKEILHQVAHVARWERPI